MCKSHPIMHIGIIHIGSRKYKTFICLFVCGNHNQQFSPTVNSSCPTTSHKPCHHEYIVIKCVECCKFLLPFHPSSFASYMYMFIIVSPFIFMIVILSGIILTILIISFQCCKNFYFRICMKWVQIMTN